MEDDQIIKFMYFDKYKPEKKIGQGSFGRIYQGVNIEGNENVAMKFEEKEKNLLETETYRMIYLKGEGVPKVYCYGNDNKYNILVMELLGRSIESYFTECKKKLSAYTVCYLGAEMVKRIRFVHEKNHIHRDIKPENFVMGIDKNIDNLYIIDFGLAKKYRSSRTKEHIPFKVNKKLTGTIRYSSVNASRCYEQSRRDDLESIGYLLVYLVKGSLPWQGLKIGQNDDRYKMISKKKKKTKVEDLCSGIHQNFQKYIEYCKGLKFDEEPKYDYLISLLIEVLESRTFKCNFDYDWNKDVRSSAMTGSTHDSIHNSSFLSKAQHKGVSNYSTSNINKNDIAQEDLKMIMINNENEDNNSIKEFKEKVKEEEKKLQSNKNVVNNNMPELISKRKQSGISNTKHNTADIKLLSSNNNKTPLEKPRSRSITKKEAQEKTPIEDAKEKGNNVDEQNKPESSMCAIY